MTSWALPSARVGRLPKARVPSGVLAENSTGLKLMGAPLESRRVAVTATGGDGFKPPSAGSSGDVSRVKSRPVYMKTRARGRRRVLSSAADSRLACAAGTVFHSTVIAVGFGVLALAAPAAFAGLPYSNSAARARIGNTAPGFHQREGTDPSGSSDTATSSGCSRVSQIETMGNSLTIKV